MHNYTEKVLLSDSAALLLYSVEWLDVYNYLFLVPSSDSACIIIHFRSRRATRRH